MSKKVDFSEYEGKYDASLNETLLTSPDSIDVETMRAYLYGYTFTKDYADGIFPQEMSMDYWRDNDDACTDIFKPWDVENECAKEEYPDLDDDLDMDIIEEILDEKTSDIESIMDDDDYFVDTIQERRLLETIDSTGDGKTAETALCVIEVGQEYEYIKRVFPYNLLSVKKQRLLEGGIDCLEFENNEFGVERIYFDISRRFEIGYPTHKDGK